MRRLAARQAGRISVAQLGHLGADADQVRRWARAGELIRVLPRVYAVGHLATSVTAELFEAMQLRRDRRNELALRGHGIELVRYDWDLVHDEPLRVRDDILARLAAGS